MSPTLKYFLMYQKFIKLPVCVIVITVTNNTGKSQREIFNEKKGCLQF